jgi:hypothetical protein
MPCRPVTVQSSSEGSHGYGVGEEERLELEHLVLTPAGRAQEEEAKICKFYQL